MFLLNCYRWPWYECFQMNKIFFSSQRTKLWLLLTYLRFLFSLFYCSICLPVILSRPLPIWAFENSFDWNFRNVDQLQNSVVCELVSVSWNVFWFLEKGTTKKGSRKPYSPHLSGRPPSRNTRSHSCKIQCLKDSISDPVFGIAVPSAHCTATSFQLIFLHSWWTNDTLERCYC